MNPQPQIAEETVANDFRELAQDKLDHAQLDEAIESLSKPATPYPATASIASLVFYEVGRFLLMSTPPT